MAEEGSFSKVGALRYITPSAVIQKINHLERELSVSLFERTNQGVRLTEAGEYLAQEARTYIAEGQRIQNALKRYCLQAKHDLCGVYPDTEGTAPVQYKCSVHAAGTFL